MSSLNIIKRIIDLCLVSFAATTQVGLPPTNQNQVPPPQPAQTQIPQARAPQVQVAQPQAVQVSQADQKQGSEPSSSPQPLAAQSPTDGQNASNVAIKKDATPFGDDLLKLRDPFRMPTIEALKETLKSELERYPVESFKLVGVLTGPERYKALVLAPDGKTYFVSENAKIGVRGGTVKQILADLVKVKEKFVNVVGQEETVEIEIRLSADPKK